MNKVELLAPGGDPQAVKAAILAGADAVFLGVGDFNARKRAVNITTKELEELCNIAHQKSCRIYLTFNTLALESEFEVLFTLLHSTIEAGIDAVILQDYGLLNVIHRQFPNLEIHASTQMNTHNGGQCAFVAPFGVSQINFSRELSLSEIQVVTQLAHNEGLQVEVFVHGAFCVSFSGQCYMSNTLNDNTANRGACVQPCRRDYTTDLLNKDVDAIRPMNLKDNSLYSSAQELIDAGVDSLKIEGRIKGHEYVFSTVSSWRDQIDRILDKSSQNSDDSRLTSVFNRAFSDNMINGIIGKDAFATDTSDESQKKVGEIVEYWADKKELTVTAWSKLGAGQRITIRDKDNRFICTGIVQKKVREKHYKFKIEHLLKGKIYGGQEIWAQPQLTDVEKLDANINNLTVSKDKQPLSMKLSGSVGGILTLITSALGKTVTVTGEFTLEEAATRPMEHSTVKERLAKLGNTPFYLAACDLSELGTNLFIPIKQLNELRREASELLTPEPQEAPSVPALPHSELPAKQKLAVVIREEKHLDELPSDGSIIALFQVPADPEILAKTAPIFETREDLIPWFPPILIGAQYDASVAFLKSYKGTEIITDNTGIAAAAKELNISWTAGPFLNASNGYALELFKKQGAVGSFLESELSHAQFNETTIPEGVELWSPLFSPVLFMNSRHCLVRNCNDCGKSVMDDWCIPNCTREATIYDEHDHPVHVVKYRGHYNSIYNSSVRLFTERLNDKRIGTFLLDFRAPHKSLMPNCSISEYIEMALKCIAGDESQINDMEKVITKRDRRDLAGLEPLLSCD